ncbi:LysR family transcriptional regulator [Paraburkholderia tropica]|uniref:LysR family transcriptional regulator n=1 Tax=Paraburkholderia tropica TaxID=92647 RepID=UPI002AB07C13|nr:LysR family transcriptional regulator [Paraburkholderia tropica]
MNSDDLAFFCLVVDAGSIAGAALSAGCDASTISRRITSLEKSFGTRLFIRSGRGVAVAPEGEVLLSYARQVALLMQAARSSISDLQRQGPPLIHIVAQPTIAKVLFGRLYHAVNTKFPRSQIHFSEALADKILVDLRTSNVDIAVMYRPEYPGSQSYEPLLYEQLYLITPPDFEVRSDQLKSKTFAEIPLILKSTHHGIRVFIQEMCARFGCEPNIVLQNDSSIAITLELIAERCGCAIMPLAAAQPFIADGRVAAHSLEDWNYERCVAIAIGRTDISSSDLWTLNGLIRGVVSELVGSGEWRGTRAA